MVSTVVPGDWVQGSEKFLDSTCKKATGGSSAIARGKVVLLNAATGVWGLPGAALGVVGKKGIVTHTNSDSDATFTVMHGGGTAYVVFDGVVKPDGPVYTSDSVNGNVKAYVNTGTFAADLFRTIIGYYKGHADEGDGSADHPKTDTANTDVAKVTLVNN